MQENKDERRRGLEVEQLFTFPHLDEKREESPKRSPHDQGENDGFHDEVEVECEIQSTSQEDTDERQRGLEVEQPLIIPQHDEKREESPRPRKHW